MNWTQVEGKWNEVKGELQQKWGKLTDDDLTEAKGQRHQLVAKIQQRYGDAKEKVEKKVDEFISSL